MEVKLLNYTADAMETLIYTKNTRLQEGITLEQIKQWTEEKKQLELSYILHTIQSSWEFIDYVFEIKDVSRAFTHQLVRTRTGSYAQESQRTVDKCSFDYTIPDMSETSRMRYKNTMHILQDSYKAMLDTGASPQQARGILPTNVCTNIIVKFNLRTLSDMAHKRLCTRTQGEYQQVFKEMKKKVIEVHPWAERFIRVYCASVGVCQFPNYKECPLKPAIFNPESGMRWDETLGYEIPKNAIDCAPEEECFGVNKAGRIMAKKSATCEQIQIGYENMEFEATPKWKGNS